ncbi:hypothetical protein BC343_16480 [Mucilaginibacter pedocola]|uniref:Helix-turn-helix domain-containing protein n=2 Tax=Mucilaginibacter pedocola TaxID=1792845 RepID=A0A1S9P8I5_9SPHI|nr:hypothetical protein BC343_16480 [Mucilaginibacter pedocola]
MPKIETNEGYLSVSEAGELIKLKPGTIYNLVNQNKIPYHKSGKRVLFKRSELAAWLITGEVHSSE